MHYSVNIIIKTSINLLMAKVKFSYIKDENYAPKYSNGAIGGITSKGEIVVNFFTEIPLSRFFTPKGLKKGF